MRKLGKVGKKWLQTRKEWVKLNPPNHAGYYICAIGGEYIPADEMELDHIQSRSRHPELRFDLNNLQPTCHNHNSEKGSR